VHSVFAQEGLALSSHQALLVVVMEYCDLGSLHRALQRRAFLPSPKWPLHRTYRALLRTAAEVAKGMQYIHEHGVVHGDLKPGNVLLKTHRADRRGYVAKVSDFGLSGLAQSDEAGDGGGATIATVAYTAPEVFGSQARGKPADVFAFGIMREFTKICCSAVHMDEAVL
jgi:serine/threonine protein kinase